MQAFRRLVQGSHLTLFSKLNIHHTAISFRFLNTSSVVYDVEENDMEKNPYFEKYADKIKQAQVEGVYKPSGDHMHEQLTLETKRWKQGIEQAEQTLCGKKEKESSNRGSKLPVNLKDLIRSELLENKSSQEIAEIWTEYFRRKEAISATIPGDIYDNMTKIKQDCPMFLYPLPRDHGYEFILSQFEGNRCFFTSLINYQVHDANAPWQLCLTFYTELRETKGIVLMASEIDATSLNVLEAQCLAHLQQMFYTNSDDENKMNLLKTFNHYPDAFKYMDLVHEVEKSNLVVKPKID